MKTPDIAIVMTSITTVRATAKNRASANLAVNATVAANVSALLAKDRANVNARANVKNPASVIALASAIAIVNVKGSVRGKNVANIDVIANVSVLLAKDRANANVIVRDAAYVYVSHAFRCADKPAFVFLCVPVTVNVIYPNDCIQSYRSERLFE